MMEMAGSKLDDDAALPTCSGALLHCCKPSPTPTLASRLSIHCRPDSWYCLGVVARPCGAGAISP